MRAEASGWRTRRVLVQKRSLRIVASDPWREVTAYGTEETVKEAAYLAQVSNTYVQCDHRDLATEAIPALQRSQVGKAHDFK